MGVLTKCQRGRFIWVRWWRNIKCVRCIGRNQLQLIGIDWNCLNLIHLKQHECVGDAPWTRGTIHMRHMIRHECVGATPWSRGNVYMRSDIYGASVLVTEGRHEVVYMRDSIYGPSVLMTVRHDSPDTSRGRMWPLPMISLACVKV
jgi:hypothetical protein